MMVKSVDMRLVTARGLRMQVGSDVINGSLQEAGSKLGERDGWKRRVINR